ncbi:MAG: FAD-binding oxidoreductase [Flavobacteriales bacterium]|nr:FAD-binding oxidoreductase [Flavobacteriales bacterium]
MKIIIIGSGLAGIAIAERFMAARCDVTVLSNTAQASSTAISTGMYNPLVFRRLNLSWMIQDLLPEIHSFYGSIEEKLAIPIKEPIEFARRIPSQDYHHLWEKRGREKPLSTYMGPIKDGYGTVKHAGMLDCTLLKVQYERYLRAENRLIDRSFSFDELSFKDGQVCIAEGNFDLVVFCDGPYATQNPYFNWLPFKLCQGEWIIIQTETPLTSRVLNNKVNVIPMGENRYKLSSSYGWETLDWQPQEEAKKDLLRGFEDLFDVPFTIIEHRAALRPTVSDRRPYLGRHPEHRSLAIFNGLGSKGVMLAPYFSKHLASHLLEDTPLMPEVDIKRHLKRFRHANEG